MEKGERSWRGWGPIEDRGINDNTAENKTNKRRNSKRVRNTEKKTIILDKKTLEILNDLAIDYALTSKVGAVTREITSYYELKRWDTNHFWDNEFRKPIMQS